MKCATAFNSGVLILLPGQRLLYTKIRNLAYGFCLFILLITLTSLYVLNNTVDFSPKLQIPPTETCSKNSLLEMSCKIPWIYTEEPDIKKWISHHGPISCTKRQPNLAFLDEDNVLTIQEDLDAKWSTNGLPFNCNVSQLTGGLKPHISAYFLNDIGVTLGVNDRLKIDKFDQFVVTCFNKTQLNETDFDNTVIYQRAFAGFAKQEIKKEKAPKASSENPSLIVLILDSTSRNQFVRHAPHALKYMEKLGFITLNAYTKVGDNSGVNLFPIFAGRTAEAINGSGPELVKELPVDAESIEFIWDLMKQKHCVGLINDDVMNAKRGFLNYHHHNGFAKSPVDYFLRPYSLFNIKNEVKPALKQCTINGQSLLNQHFEFLERMSRVFAEHCHLSISFLPTPTHDKPSYLETEDVEIRTLLEKFKANGVLDNSAVVIMGDHGNRIDGIQYTFTGRIEERMSLFSLYLPPSLNNAYPHFRKNFEHNTNRLVSNYDIYKTFRTLALLGQKKKVKEQIPYRGYSLLEERVPKKRSCYDAGIPENFCTCLIDKALPRYRRTSKMHNQFVAAVQDYFVSTFKKCLNLSTLFVNDDEIRALSINPMVRQGWRLIEPNKTVDYNSFMEFIYHDVNLNVTSVTNQKLHLLIRVKNYVREQKYAIPHVPIILEELKNSTEACSNRIRLNDYCKQMLSSLNV